MGLKGILHEQGGGGGSPDPPKNGIICTTVLDGHPYEVFGNLSLTKTVQSTKQFGVIRLTLVNIWCTLIIFNSSSVCALGVPSPVMVGLELAVAGVKLTPWTKEEIIPLCLKNAQSRAIHKGVAVLRQQIVKQK